MEDKFIVQHCGLDKYEMQVFQVYEVVAFGTRSMEVLIPCTGPQDRKAKQLAKKIATLLNSEEKTNG
jgi:hypothetical protein